MENPIVNCRSYGISLLQGYDINKVRVHDERVEKYNSVVEQLALDWPTIQKLTDIDISVEDYDRALQSTGTCPKNTNK